MSDIEDWLRVHDEELTEIASRQDFDDYVILLPMPSVAEVREPQGTRYRPRRSTPPSPSSAAAAALFRLHLAREAPPLTATATSRVTKWL
jgi:hypothetical protein